MPRENSLHNLRQKALDILDKKVNSIKDRYSDMNINELLTELDIYNAELTAQNEELQDTINTLRELTTKFNRLFHDAPLSYLVLDKKYRVLEYNQVALKLFGPQLSMMEKCFLSSFIEIAGYSDFLEWMKNEKPSLETTLKIGKNRVAVIFERVHWEEGEILLTIQDISELSEYRRSLEESIEKQVHEIRIYKEVVDSMNEAVVITKSDATIIDVNPAYERITGYEREFIIGKNPRVLKSGKHDENFYVDMWENLINKGKWQGEIWDKRRSGDLFPKWLSISSIKDDEGQIKYFIGVFQDITERNRYKERLLDMAYKDPLTKLPNRAEFKLRLIQELEASRTIEENGALILIDLDHFKEVNDTLGHTMGDKLLQEVADRLSGLVRKVDLVARLGGDEFAIVLSAPQRHSLLEGLCGRINAALKKVFVIDENRIHIGCSIGVAFFPKDSSDMEGLVKAADIAMYKVKEGGRDSYRFFTQEIGQSSFDKQEIESEIEAALTKGELEIYFQPKIAVSSGRLIGVEALVRWNHPKKGLLTPDEFLAVADMRGMIKSIDEFVVSEALEKIVKINAKQKVPLSISINLSSAAFCDASFIDTLIDLSKTLNIDSSLINIEITESAIMANTSYAAEVMKKLTDRGIGIAIDDFGSGYTSLSLLKNLPIKELKIDRSFIQGMSDSREDMAIVETIATLAKNLGGDVVAKYVENEAQLEELRRFENIIVQGHIYSKALSLNALLAYIRTQAYS